MTKKKVHPKKNAKEAEAPAPGQQSPLPASQTEPEEPSPSEAAPSSLAPKSEAPPAEPAEPHDRIRPVPVDEVDELRKSFAALEHEFLRVKQERDELKDEYIRKLAEMDNLRKRVEREKIEYRLYALDSLLKEILAVADNFARALSGPSGDNGKSFQEGMELIHKQLMDFLIKNGVTPIEAKGRPFDPALHQAFDTEEAEDVTEPVVAEEMQKGYLLHGRLLRPALVRVRIPKKG